MTTYTLLIDGQPLDAAYLPLLQTVEAEEHLRMADMLRLVLHIAVAEDGSGWRVLDEGTFAPLVNLQLQITVGNNNPVTVVDAYVVETQTVFSNNPGESTLTVLAMDATVLMNRNTLVRSWPGMADSDIATSIFNEYGFTPAVTATEVTYDEENQLVIQRSTDIQFLQMLAQRHGFDVYVDVNPDAGNLTGYFGPLELDAEPQGLLTIHMGQSSNLNFLNVRWDMLRPTSVQVANIDFNSGDNQEGVIDGSNQTILGGEDLFALAPPRQSQVLPGCAVLEAELLALAQGLSNRSSFAIIAEGELSTENFGTVLRAKRTVLLRGVGNLYSGVYLVERVLHAFIDGEYTQSFTLRRNATSPRNRDDFTPEEA
ncbi:MAG: phage late control D family protein [Chloroflexia bacterium]|nr:phage late control D family protein [Chloroflexia bacterium]